MNHGLTEIDDLYKEIILDHYRTPRNKVDLSGLDDEETLENPSCGDSVKLQIELDDDGRIQSACFDGHGCAISTASASLMTERLIGLNLEEARSLMAGFIGVLRGEKDESILNEWGDLVVMAGVRQYPMRVKCATLAWHALEKNLEKLKERL